MLPVTLIGFGAIGQSLLARMHGHAGLRITHVVVPQGHRAEARARAGAGVCVTDAVPAETRLALECAGHGALSTHVLPALERGVECAVLSVGALSEPGLAERLDDAARRGGTRLHLLSGAIGGIDAIAAARSRRHGATTSR